MIGVGGSFRNLFKISKLVKKYPLDTVHNYNLAVEDFSNIYDMIKVLDIDKRKKIKGPFARPARTSCPRPWQSVKAFGRYLDIDKFTIGGSGLREGIMFNQALPTRSKNPFRTC